MSKWDKDLDDADRGTVVALLARLNGNRANGDDMITPLCAIDLNLREWLDEDDARQAATDALPATRYATEILARTMWEGVGMALLGRDMTCGQPGCTSCSNPRGMLERISYARALWRRWRQAKAMQKAIALAHNGQSELQNLLLLNSAVATLTSPILMPLLHGGAIFQHLQHEVAQREARTGKKEAMVSVVAKHGLSALKSIAWEDVEAEAKANPKGICATMVKACEEMGGPREASGEPQQTDRDARLSASMTVAGRA